MFPLFESDTLDSLPFVPEALRADVREALNRREFKGRLGDCYLTRGVTPDARVILVGLGPQAKGSADSWRRAASAAALTARGRGLHTLVIVAPRATADECQAIAEGIQLAALDVDTYRTSPRDPVALIDVQVAAEGDASVLGAALERGRILGVATNTARALANEPGNVLPPRELAARATRPSRRRRPAGGRARGRRD